MAKHYILTDESGRIMRGFSDDFEQPDTSAICINEDGGRHFELNGVINPPMTDYNGTPLYKLDGGKVVARTQEELDADKPAETPAITTPTIEDRTAALESALLELVLGGAV